jgi:hypothetical protein
VSTRVRRPAWRLAGSVAAGLLVAGTLAACGGGSSGAGAPAAGVGSSGGGAGVSGGATVHVSQDDLDALHAATSDAESTATQAEQDLASDG